MLNFFEFKWKFSQVLQPLYSASWTAGVSSPNPKW